MCVIWMIVFQHYHLSASQHIYQMAPGVDMFINQQPLSQQASQPYSNMPQWTNSSHLTHYISNTVVSPH